MKNSRQMIECPVCYKGRYVALPNMKRSTYTGLCTDCSRQSHKGSENPNWTGGRRSAGSYGEYVQVYAPDHPNRVHNCVLEHRLVVEQELGRYLLNDEIVHHLNGVKNDNRFENLALTKRIDHESHTSIRCLQRRIRELEQLHLAIQEDTLKAVGAWLEGYWESYERWLKSPYEPRTWLKEDIDRLKQGNMPNQTN